MSFQILRYIQGMGNSAKAIKVLFALEDSLHIPCQVCKASLDSSLVTPAMRFVIF